MKIKKDWEKKISEGLIERNVKIKNKKNECVQTIIVMNFKCTVEISSVKISVN